MKSLLLIFGLVLATGCAARLTPVPAMQSPEAQLYIAKCSVCHSVPHPKRHTYAQWVHMMTVMEKQMHLKEMTLTAEEKETILAYLEKNAR